MRAAKRRGYPAAHARLLLASAGAKGLPHPGFDRSALKEANRDYALFNETPFVATFYFKRLEGKSLDVEFCIESNEPFWLHSVEAHAAPDALCREFERGVVLANPSPRSYRFELADLLPGRSYRRINGTALQDPRTNDGQPVGQTVELGPMDGLFLVREH
jgi:hypothetical protein